MFRPVYTWQGRSGLWDEMAACRSTLTVGLRDRNFGVLHQSLENDARLGCEFGIYASWLMAGLRRPEETSGLDLSYP